MKKLLFAFVLTCASQIAHADEFILGSGIFGAGGRLPTGEVVNLTIPSNQFRLGSTVAGVPQGPLMTDLPKGVDSFLAGTGDLRISQVPSPIQGNTNFYNCYNGTYNSGCLNYTSPLLTFTDTRPNWTCPGTPGSCTPTLGTIATTVRATGWVRSPYSTATNSNLYKNSTEGAVGATGDANIALSFDDWIYQVDTLSNTSLLGTACWSSTTGTLATNALYSWTSSACSQATSNFHVINNSNKKYELPTCSWVNDQGLDYDGTKDVYIELFCGTHYGHNNTTIGAASVTLTDASGAHNVTHSTNQFSISKRQWSTTCTFTAGSFVGTNCGNVDGIQVGERMVVANGLGTGSIPGQPIVGQIDTVAGGATTNCTIGQLPCIEFYVQRYMSGTAASTTNASGQGGLWDATSAQAAGSNGNPNGDGQAIADQAFPGQTIFEVGAGGVIGTNPATVTSPTGYTVAYSSISGGNIASATIACPTSCTGQLTQGSWIHWTGQPVSSNVWIKTLGTLGTNNWTLGYCPSTTNSCVNPPASLTATTFTSTELAPSSGTYTAGTTPLTGTTAMQNGSVTPTFAMISTNATVSTTGQDLFQIRENYVGTGGSGIPVYLGPPVPVLQFHFTAAEIAGLGSTAENFWFYAVICPSIGDRCLDSRSSKTGPTSYTKTGITSIGESAITGGGLSNPNETVNTTTDFTSLLTRSPAARIEISNTGSSTWDGIYTLTNATFSAGVGSVTVTNPNAVGGWGGGGTVGVAPAWQTSDCPGAANFWNYNADANGWNGTTIIQDAVATTNAGICNSTNGAWFADSGLSGGALLLDNGAFHDLSEYYDPAATSGYGPIYVFIDPFGTYPTSPCGSTSYTCVYDSSHLSGTMPTSAQFTAGNRVFPSITVAASAASHCNFNAGGCTNMTARGSSNTHNDIGGVVFVFVSSQTAGTGGTLGSMTCPPVNGLPGITLTSGVPGAPLPAQLGMVGWLNGARNASTGVPSFAYTHNTANIGICNNERVTNLTISDSNTIFQGTDSAYNFHTWYKGQLIFVGDFIRTQNSGNTIITKIGNTSYLDNMVDIIAPGSFNHILGVSHQGGSFSGNNILTAFNTLICGAPSTINTSYVDLSTVLGNMGYNCDYQGGNPGILSLAPFFDPVGFIKQGISAYNRWMNTVANTYNSVPTGIVQNILDINNLTEITTAQSGGDRISSDDNLMPVKNAVRDYVAVIGQRSNSMYQDGLSPAIGTYAPPSGTTIGAGTYCVKIDYAVIGNPGVRSSTDSLVSPCTGIQLVTTTTTQDIVVQLTCDPNVVAYINVNLSGAGSPPPTVAHVLAGGDVNGYANAVSMCHTYIIDALGPTETALAESVNVPAHLVPKDNATDRFDIFYARAVQLESSTATGAPQAGGRVGNWDFSYGIAHMGIIATNGQNSTGVANSQIPMMQVTCQLCYNAAAAFAITQSADYTNQLYGSYRAYGAAQVNLSINIYPSPNTGEGYYCPSTNADVSIANSGVPNTFASWPWDTNGTPRINTGTGTIGVYEGYVGHGC